MKYPKMKDRGFQVPYFHFLTFVLHFYVLHFLVLQFHRPRLIQLYAVTLPFLVCQRARWTLPVLRLSKVILSPKTRSRGSSMVHLSRCTVVLVVVCSAGGTNVRTPRAPVRAKVPAAWNELGLSGLRRRRRYHKERTRSFSADWTELVH